MIIRLIKLGDVKVQKELDTTPLTLSVMHFWGINNDDFWTRPELIYNAKNGITYQILADIFIKITEMDY
ncbi:MAG: hypothetical protein U0T83_07365 [Bacteriovoracaceae bacterium]